MTATLNLSLILLLLSFLSMVLSIDTNTMETTSDATPPTWPNQFSIEIAEEIWGRASEQALFKGSAASDAGKEFMTQKMAADTIKCSF